MQMVVQTKIEKEQQTPKRLCFRGFLYVVKRKICPFNRQYGKIYTIIREIFKYVLIRKR